MVFNFLNGEVAIPSEEFLEFNCTRTRYQPKTDVLKYAMLLLNELYQSGMIYQRR